MHPLVLSYVTTLSNSSISTVPGDLGTDDEILQVQ